MQLTTQLSITKIDGAGAATGGVNHTAIDMDGYDGLLILTSFGTPAADNNFKLQSSDASGSGYADVAGSAVNDGVTTKNFAIELYHPLKRYHRLVSTRGTSSTVNDIWVIRYKGRKRAIDNAVSAGLVVKQLVSAAQGTA